MTVAMLPTTAPNRALEGRTPSPCYQLSTRPFPKKLPPLEYPGHFLVKRVTESGTIRLKDKLLFLANPLKLLHVRLEEADDGIRAIHFANVLLAKVDERDMTLRECHPQTTHKVLPIIPA